MTAFQKDSKTFLKDLSRVAEWMMRRSVGPNHWWRWPVLTAANTDPDSPPKFDEHMARRMFEELERRGLIAAFKDASGKPVRVDQSDEPAYYVVYNPEGWEKAVSDGRPIRGRWLKLRRNWLMILVTFVLGAVGGALKDQASSVVKWGIESVVGKPPEQRLLEEEKKAPETPPPSQP